MSVLRIGSIIEVQHTLAEAAPTEYMLRLWLARLDAIFNASLRALMIRCSTSSPSSVIPTGSRTLVEMYFRWPQSMVCHVVGPRGQAVLS